VKYTRMPAESRSFHGDLIRHEFQVPPGWTKTESETLSIARKRRAAAMREIGHHPKAWRTVLLYRLTNPYMAQHAWRLMLNMAKREAVSA